MITILLQEKMLRKYNIEKIKNEKILSVKEIL